jgi:hypothetical protein
MHKKQKTRIVVKESQVHFGQVCPYWTLVMCAILPLGLLWGCATTQTVNDNAPDWYDAPPKGCAAGDSKIRSNRGMARDKAVDSGRVRLAGQLKTQVGAMMKRYTAEGEKSGEDFTEDLATRVSRSVVKQTLVGTRATKTKVIGKEYFALVCIDPSAFANAFKEMNELSGAQRAALENAAKLEFQDLDAQLDKIK